jgi:murein DD-endopeptidase MepM/ murein hydrolase activator NlpD
MTYKSSTLSPARVFLEYIAVLLIIVIPISVHAGIFGGNTEVSADNGTSETVIFGNSALDVDVLSAEQNPNPQGARGGAEVVVHEDTLVSSGPVGADTIATTKVSSGEISVYTVREGDTLSHIAEMYGVTSNTILWANDLTRASSIRPGQTLIILPIAGVRHVVKKGDTINSIAKQYDGDVEEILSYNELSAEDGLIVGNVVVVPGGAMHTAPAKAASPVRTSGSSSVTGGGWLSHPAPGTVKTQGLHGYNAVDFAASVGSPIRAGAAGEVIVSKSSGWNGGYGQYIVIRHANGAQTLYAHLSRNDVGVGAYVSQGETIGAMGNTGRSTGPHLHFEVRGANNPF